MQHDLKTWCGPFGAIWDGKKRCEIRTNDRNYVLGDVLRLREYLPEHDAYTGRELFCDVSHIVYGGQWGLPSDICVMSIGVSGRVVKSGDGA